MKHLLATLTAAVAIVAAVNLGLHYGLTAKPVLDLNECAEVIRYEDNSLVCKTATHEYTMTTEDEGQTDDPLIIRGDEYRPAQAMTGAQLQPAETIEHYQPVKKYR